MDDQDYKELIDEWMGKLIYEALYSEYEAKRIVRMWVKDLKRTPPRRHSGISEGGAV